MYPTVLFDLDDTLSYGTKYYHDVQAKGSKFISDVTGVSEAMALELIQTIDLAAAKAEPRFRKERFPSSFVEALLDAGNYTGRPVTMTDVSTVYNLGDSVYTAEYELRKGAKDIIASARSLGYNTVLVTKGDPEVQNYKIDKNELRDYFDNIHIVETKNKLVWGSIVEMNSILSQTSYIIGDSLKDDIAPCKELGITTIHISTENAWAYNAIDGIKPDYQVDCLTEVRGILVSNLVAQV